MDICTEGQKWYKYHYRILTNFQSSCEHTRQHITEQSELDLTMEMSATPCYSQTQVISRYELFGLNICIQTFVYALNVPTYQWFLRKQPEPAWTSPGHC